MFNTFPYIELRKICDQICELGYDSNFVDNGNIVFQKKEDNQQFPSETKKIISKLEDLLSVADEGDWGCRLEELIKELKKQ